MKKIMFSDKFGLTKAVLNGEKSQTRRVIKCSDELRTMHFSYFNCKGEAVMVNSIGVAILSPSYAVGEVVAVAQNYFDLYHAYKPSETAETFWRQNGSAGWGNKMFVKAELMPHHIRITNIRMERLQDISEEDCLAEGIYEEKGGFDETNYTYKGIGNSMFGTARCAYMSLIDKVCGRYVWNQNPYVFVYDFELID